MADSGPGCPFPAVALRIYRIQLTEKLQDADALDFDTTGLLAEIRAIDRLRYAHEGSARCPCWWAVIDRVTAALLEEL